MWRQSLRLEGCGHKLRIARSHQKLEKVGAGGISPQEISEGAHAADTVILDFWPTELWENEFL